MSDNNVTENFEADAADIAAAAAATEEFTNTIGEIMVTETEVETDLPTYHEGPIQTVGRRKRAIVRVRMVEGSGQFVCNGRTLEEYFPNKRSSSSSRHPWCSSTVTANSTFTLTSPVAAPPVRQALSDWLSPGLSTSIIRQIAQP